MEGWGLDPGVGAGGGEGGREVPGDSRKILDGQPQADGQENTQDCPNETETASFGARSIRMWLVPCPRLEEIWAVFHLFSNLPHPLNCSNKAATPAVSFRCLPTAQGWPLHHPLSFLLPSIPGSKHYHPPNPTLDQSQGPAPPGLYRHGHERPERTTLSCGRPQSFGSPRSSAGHHDQPSHRSLRLPLPCPSPRL